MTHTALTYDPDELSVPASLSRAFAAATAAHIAIDLQRAYSDPTHSYCKQFGDLAKRTSTLAEPVNNFARMMRGAGLRNIWVAHAFKGAVDDRPDFVPDNYRDHVRMAKRELFNIEREKSDAVVCKHHFDAFEDTQLDRMLKKRRIDTLLLTGAFFDQCVKATAERGVQLGYQVFVVRDLSVAVYENLSILNEYEQAGVGFVNARAVSALVQRV